MSVLNSNALSFAIDYLDCFVLNMANMIYFVTLWHTASIYFTY